MTRSPFPFHFMTIRHDLIRGSLAPIHDFCAAGIVSLVCSVVQIRESFPKYFRDDTEHTVLQIFILECHLLMHSRSSYKQHHAEINLAAYYYN